MTIEQKKWFHVRARHVPCLWTANVYWYMLDDVKKYFGVESDGIILHVWDKGYYTGVLDMNLLSKFSKKCLEDFKTVNDLHLFRERGARSGDPVIQYCKDYTDKESDFTPSSVAQFLTEVRELYQDIMKSNMYYWLLVTPSLEKEIRNELGVFSAEDVDHIFAVMTEPDEESYSNIQERDFLTLLNTVRKHGLESAEARTNIKNFSDDYIWFPFEYAGPTVWDIPTITKRIKDQLAQSVDESHVNHDTEETKQIQARCIAEFNLNEKVVELFRRLRTLTTMQDDRKSMNAKVCYYVNGVVLKKLAEKYSIPYEHILYADCDTVKMLETDINEAKSILRRRSEYFVMVHDGNKEVYLDTKDARLYIDEKQIFTESHKEGDEIKGQIAFKGKVSGIARICKTSSPEVFNSGDILVTGMTTPDFVPLLKRASAIVTDEGGITCHAAIISRELRKPCITGTGNATKVLKDGDMIEVDAEKGTVTIIKNKVYAV